jgi:Asp-tRNA(Asn)/Glu-tRNA(Gln) amidotransferase A subunit family amidase
MKTNPFAPRVSGALLRATAQAARTRAGAALVYHAYRKEVYVDRLAELPRDARGDLLLDNHAWQARPPRVTEDQGLPLPAPPWSGTSQSYTEAYAQKRVTPQEVAAHALRAARTLAGHAPSVGPIHQYADEATLQADAEKSSARYARGDVLGPFDGVPFSVKEQTGVAGFARQAGTTYLTRAAVTEDATAVGPLRQGGALVLGTTSMTEFGMTPIGVNPHRPLPKNPHDPSRIAGGSSTGAGVSVATGLTPFAIGADGGGSIRIPSAINGVFGIKATWGRVSRHGDIGGGSVAHVGPLASSTADLARVLETIGAPDPRDSETQPATAIVPGSLVRALGRGVRGLRIAVDEREWGDASPSVQRAGREALRALEKEGAVLVSATIGLAEHALAIGCMTIGLETRGLLHLDWAEHASEFSADLQVTMAALGEARAADFVDAQRLRTGIRREVAKVLATADLIALPTTAGTAAAASDAEMRSGFMDPTLLKSLCRFNFLGNLTGLPALSAPVGLDGDGLPIGFQLMGDAWDEATVLAASAHLERIGAARVTQPRVFVPSLVA